MSQRWEPIHTAPRNGQMIDLWHEAGFRIPDCRYVYPKVIEYPSRTKQWVNSEHQVVPSETITHWIDRMPQQ